MNTCEKCWWYNRDCCTCPYDTSPGDATYCLEYDEEETYCLEYKEE